MNEKLKSFMALLDRNCESYKSFVKRNVELIGEVESALKWMSYILAGQSKSPSPVLSELLYSSSNILLLINDLIIKQGLRKTSDPPVQIFWRFSDEHFRIILTLIEYLEVFIEISSLKVWGNRGKWLAISVVQFIKCILRLIYLLKEKVGFLFSPPIRPLTSSQRKMAKNKLQSECNSEMKPVTEEPKSTEAKNISLTFTLKRSGRTIRRVSAASTALGRSWKVPDENVMKSNELDIDFEPKVKPTTLDQSNITAELIHILRPMAHLLALGLCGPLSWKPWLMALGMDLTSLRLIGDPTETNLNLLEKKEIKLRRWALLYYMLRSPFFDLNTKKKMTRVLGALSSTIPGAKYICNPLIEYLPSWQKVYFYTWSH